MLFASGYYPQVEDPAAQTKAYVQEAIEYYQANGLDSTIAHYNSQESVDGQWSLTLADEKNIVRVAFLAQRTIGTDLKDLARGRVRQIGEELAAATTEGIWVSHIFPNTRSSETLYAHNWAIRYDGLIFMSRYYDDRRDVPNGLGPHTSSHAGEGRRYPRKGQTDGQNGGGEQSHEGHADADIEYVCETTE